MHVQPLGLASCPALIFSSSFPLQAVRPSCTFVPQAPARTVASAQSAGVALAVTVLWALVAKTVASVSGHHGAGGPCRVSKAYRICNPTSPLHSAMAHPYRFHGNGTLSWDFGNDMTVSVPWYLGLAFRTRATKGVLMQVQLGPHSVLLCQVCLPFQSFTLPSLLISNAPQELG